MQELGYYFLNFGNNSIIVSCDSFLHVKKSSLALFNLVVYTSCYFIQKYKKVPYTYNSPTAE